MLCPNHSDAHDVPPPSTYLQQLFPDSQIDINTFGEGKKCYAQITVNQRIQFMDYYFYEDEATAQEAAALYLLCSVGLLADMCLKNCNPLHSVSW